MVCYDIEEPTKHEEGASENKPGHKNFVNYSLPGWVQHPLKSKSLKVAMLFPGEQNHYVGMLKDLRKKPVVKDMIAKATAKCGFDIGAMMKDGPAAAMKPTNVNQIIIYVADCAAFEAMKEKHPDVAKNPQAVAGFSVGEYAALYAAGVITFEQGLDIVKVRADAMQELADDIEMEALVIRGVPQDKLERQLKSAEKLDREAGSDPDVYVSRYWCPEGYVCAGKKSTVLKLRDVVERETKSAEVRLLPDHMHAGHTPMARDAAAKVANVLERIYGSMQSPRCEVFLNSTGTRVAPGADPSTFIGALKDQLASPIQWSATVNAMLMWGIREFYECGPSRSLTFIMGYHEFTNEAPLYTVKAAELTKSVPV